MIDELTGTLRVVDREGAIRHNKVMADNIEAGGVAIVAERVVVLVPAAEVPALVRALEKAKRTHVGPGRCWAFPCIKPSRADLKSVWCDDHRMCDWSGCQEPFETMRADGVRRCFVHKFVPDKST